MKEDLFQKLLISIKEVRELFGQELYCNNCEKTLANIKMKTKNGCVWCDSEYWLKRKKNENTKKKI